MSTDSQLSDFSPADIEIGDEVAFDFAHAVLKGIVVDEHPVATFANPHERRLSIQTPGERETTYAILASDVRPA